MGPPIDPRTGVRFEAVDRATLSGLRLAVICLTACGSPREPPLDAAPADAGSVEDSGPAREVCDGKDNDGDGEVDEGVQSECGDCSACSISCQGRGCSDPLRAKDGVDVVGCPDEPDGECVTLGPASTGGTISYIVEGCRGLGGQDWYIVDFEAVVPEGASIGFDGRSALTLDELAVEPWTPIGVVPPETWPLRVRDPLDSPTWGAYMEVRASLSRTAEPPRLLRLGIGMDCWV